MGRTLKPPLDLVLAWQTDAYPHGVRRDHTLLILATVFSAIAFIFVLVRLIARLGVQRNPGLDDLFIVPALISTIGMNVCIAYSKEPEHPNPIPWPWFNLRFPQRHDMDLTDMFGT